MIHAKVVQLASQDVLLRDQARSALVALGEAAVPALIEALSSADGNVRWEAARALGELRAAAAAPALVAALRDTRFDVRWLAAQGLIALGNDGIAPLLRALRDAPWDAVLLREGAYHILRSQVGGASGNRLAPVVAALEGPEPAVSVPLAAYRVLQQLE
jgi:HEAT repeat protein